MAAKSQLGMSTVTLTALALRLFFRLLDMFPVVLCFAVDGGALLALTGAESVHLDSLPSMAQDAYAAERDAA